MFSPAPGEARLWSGRPCCRAGPPLAVGLLRASAQLPAAPLLAAAFLGELALDGALRHTPGILPMVLVAREAYLRRANAPAPDADEAVVVGGVEVVPVPTLAGLADELRGPRAIRPSEITLAGPSDSLSGT